MVRQRSPELAGCLIGARPPRNRRLSAQPRHGRTTTRALPSVRRSSVFWAVGSRPRMHLLRHRERLSRKVEEFLVLVAFPVAVGAHFLGEGEDLLGEVEQLSVLAILLLH